MDWFSMHASVDKEDMKRLLSFTEKYCRSRGIQESRFRRRKNHGKLPALELCIVIIKAAAAAAFTSSLPLGSLF